MKKRKESCIRVKVHNGGSTLIVVLVAISFLVIVASIIMTVSSANLRMKQIEYAMKQNFYVDETGLEDIYNGIGRDVSQILAKSYSKTLILKDEGSYQSQKEAYNAFVNYMKKDLEALYGEASDSLTDEKKTESKANTLNILNAYISRETDSDEKLKVESFKGINIIDDTAETGAAMRQYVIQEVKVRYTKENKYESVITTDIVIEMPYINFFQDFTEVLEYALIGNKGIYFKQEGTIEGNVYAGIDSKGNNATYDGYKYSAATKVYDGINFYKANVTFNNASYIVSKGDFNICESNVNIEAKTSASTGEAKSNLWAENIRIVEDGRSYSVVGAADEDTEEGYDLKATANIYVADDLELNKTGSKVLLKGNYYGYNFNNNAESAYKTYESANLSDLYTSSFHTTSSSIIINGSNSTLDLTGLNTLMVAGVAYLDIRNGVPYSEMAEASASEYKTSESIAVRSNQFLYLAPSEILKEGVSNPQKGSDGEAEVWDEDKLKTWFGNAYLKAENPVVSVAYEDNSEVYTYYYLNFESGNEINYVTDVMSAEEPLEDEDEAAEQKWELKQEILRRLKDSSVVSQIFVGTVEEGGANIYTSGLLTNANEVMQASTISSENMILRSTNMQNRYKHLYLKLDSTGVEDIDVSSTDKYPLAAFLDMDRFGSDKLPNEQHSVDGISDASVWLYGTDTSITIKGNQKGIILCDGNVTIKGEAGSVFEGLIVASGKITVEGSINIKANSGIVQAILEAEQRQVIEANEEELKDMNLNAFASRYFKQTVLAQIEDKSEIKTIDTSTRITSTDYTDYIYYDNWKRGEISTFE